MKQIFTLTINSDLHNVEQVEPFLERFKSQCGLDDRLYYDVLVVLTEAVNNSIIHGNGRDPDKKVQIIGIIEEERIEFVVEDEGRGFDFNNVPDPTCERLIAQPNGRGVHIMRNLADYLDYTEKGRKVRIQFAI